MGWARPYRSSFEVTLRSMRSTSSAEYAVTAGQRLVGMAAGHLTDGWVRPGAVGVILRDG